MEFQIFDLHVCVVSENKDCLVLGRGTPRADGPHCIRWIRVQAKRYSKWNLAPGDPRRRDAVRWQCDILHETGMQDMARPGTCNYIREGRSSFIQEVDDAPQDGRSIIYGRTA